MLKSSSKKPFKKLEQQSASKICARNVRDAFIRGQIYGPEIMEKAWAEYEMLMEGQQILSREEFNNILGNEIEKFYFEEENE